MIRVASCAARPLRWVVSFALLLAASLLGGCASTAAAAPARPLVPELAPSTPGNAAPFAALFRDLPPSAAEAAKAFAARVEAVDARCPFAHVDGLPGEVWGSFDTCPRARGSLRATFGADGERLHVKLELHDFWLRGGDLMTGAWALDVAADGEPSFDGDAPWQGMPAKGAPAAPKTARSSATGSSSGFSALKGKGGVILLPFVLVGALASASR